MSKITAWTILTASRRTTSKSPVPAKHNDITNPHFGLGGEDEAIGLGKAAVARYAPLMRGTAVQYRELAERTRKLADDIPDADMRAHMLDVSRQYAKLAEEAEPTETE